MSIFLQNYRFLNHASLRSLHKATKAYGTVTKKPAIDFNSIKHPTKVPFKPVVSVDAIKSEKVKIDKETIELLMRLSLVNLSDE